MKNKTMFPHDHDSLISSNAEKSIIKYKEKKKTDEFYNDPFY